MNRMGRHEAKRKNRFALMREERRVIVPRGPRKEMRLADASAESQTSQRIFHADDGGFTTTGMVLALLVTLSMIFSAAQVQRINAKAADIQDVADAAALAAENDVAEFYLAARVCDAAVLSLSLTGLAALGLGTAALCVPPTAPLGESLIRAGDRIIKARDSFAQKAAKGLESLQKLLPFICAARAAAVVDANNATNKTECFGFAVTLPSAGEPISVGGLESAASLSQDIQAQAEEIKDAAKQAEEAAQEANVHKERAYQADCGASPGYCLHERAQSLAGMTGADNPYYASSDTWSFSVALARSQAYYPCRLALERPDGSSTHAKADSALRRNFYAFACQEVSRGYVHDDPSGTFDADFPLLPRNTDEMRATSLYTDAIYPLTEDDEGGFCLHATDECPYSRSHALLGRGSLQQMEETEGFSVCPDCEFVASSLGKVAAASTSIENGFEYHYQIVAQEAAEYQKAQEEFAPQATRVKDTVGPLFERLSEAFSDAVGKRLKVAPPGRFGAVALVVDTAGVDAGSDFPSSFVAADARLGSRAALSAAVLAEESSNEASNAISAALEGLGASTGIGPVGVGSAVLGDLWGGMLQVYADGQEGLEAAIQRALDAIPFAGASGLGSWASQAFSQLVESVGLEPVDMDTPKPVLVNSSHSLSADEGSFAQTLLRMKTAYAELPGSGTGTPLEVLVDALEQGTLEAVEERQSLVVATIDIGGGEVPIEITLPPAARKAAETS